MNPLYVWIVLLILSVIVEMSTAALVSIWLTFGCVAAILANLLGGGEMIQIIVFVLVTAISFATLYKWAKDRLKKPGNKLHTNVEKYIGKTAICTKNIDNVRGEGEVIANGIYWSAKSADNSKIEKDAICVIKQVDGSRLIVEKVEDKENKTEEKKGE